jgi:hypothetical protein
MVNYYAIRSTPVLRLQFAFGLKIHDDLPRQAQDKDAVDSKSSERKRGHYCAFFSSVVAAGQHRSLLHLREAGKKTPFLRHFALKMHHFTKTGSGQT